MLGREHEVAQLSSERRDEMLEHLAQRIRAKGLAAPAVLLLEAHKPLSFLGSQAILILQPLLSFAFDAATSSEYARLLEDGENVELLIRRLETRENDRA